MIVLLFFFALVILTVLYVWSVRRNLVASYDHNELSTKNGKRYPWGELVRVEYLMVWQKGTKKLRSMLFHFKTGTASVGYLMSSIHDLMAIADKLNVPKSEKLVGSVR